MFIQSPTPGTWTIEVKVNELNQDGDPETPGVTDIDFGLVVFGVQDSSCASAVFVDRNGDGRVDISDFTQFLSEFMSGSADTNRDGVTDSTDLYQFIDAFFAVNI